MAEDISRRNMIKKTAGATAAGVVAGSALGNGVAAAAPRKEATQNPRVGTVVRHYGGSHAEVAVPAAAAVGAAQVLTVPLDGFPAGWQLRPGDRVGLIRTAQAAQAANPLVHPARGPLTHLPHPGTMMQVGDVRGLITEQTITKVGDRLDGSTDYIADFIENEHGRPPVCVALRPYSPPVRR